MISPDYDPPCDCDAPGELVKGGRIEQGGGGSMLAFRRGNAPPDARIPPLVRGGIG